MSRRIGLAGYPNHGNRVGLIQYLLEVFILGHSDARRRGRARLDLFEVHWQADLEAGQTGTGRDFDIAPMFLDDVVADVQS